MEEKGRELTKLNYNNLKENIEETNNLLNDTVTKKEQCQPLRITKNSAPGQDKTLK